MSVACFSFMHWVFLKLFLLKFWPLLNPKGNDAVKSSQLLDEVQSSKNAVNLFPHKSFRGIFSGTVHLQCFAQILRCVQITVIPLTQKM